MSNNLTNANEKSDSQRKSPAKLTAVKAGQKQKSNIYKGSLSENNIKQNKQTKLKNVTKATNKVEANSALCSVEARLTEQFGGMSLTPDQKSSKDNLEYLDLKIEEEKSHTSSLDKRNSNFYKSSPALTESKPGTSHLNNLKWDPYDKQNRKNRKDYKKKKPPNRNFDSSKNEDTIPLEGNAHKEKLEEPKDNTEESLNYLDEETYKFKYFPKNTKSVVFTKDVLVVYFNGEEIITESKEPLKKEIEQQIRNKEMRRTHLIKTQEKYNLCLF